MRVCYGQLFFYFTFAMLYLFLTSPNTNPHILYPSLVAYILGLGGAIIAIFRWCMLLYLNLFVIQTTVFYMSIEARIGNTTWQSNYLEKLHDRWVCFSMEVEKLSDIMWIIWQRSKNDHGKVSQEETQLKGSEVHRLKAMVPCI